MAASGEGRVRDPRPARTRAALCQAALELADASEPLSVQAIARRAGVSRSSFYSQFERLDDLAVVMLIEVFHQIGTQDLLQRSASVSDTRLIAERSARQLVDHLDERRTFYRAAVDWGANGSVTIALVEAFGDQVAQSMTALGDRVPAGLDPADAARYIGGGAIALLTAWLRDPMQLPRDEMSRRLLAVMPIWLVGDPDLCITAEEHEEREIQ